MCAGSVDVVVIINLRERLVVLFVVCPRPVVYQLECIIFMTRTAEYRFEQNYKRQYGFKFWTMDWMAWY